MSREVESKPKPRTRATAFAVLFGSFAILVSAIIWFTGEHSDFVDYLFIFCFPPVFAAVAYFIGFYIPDEPAD